MNVKALIEASFADAKAKRVEGSTKQVLHQRRSRSWVESLAHHLAQQFQSDPNVLVFSKYNPSHRKDFGLNELLYDIVVCRVGTVESARHKTHLRFVQDALWEVESEFARDSRQALVDFNKLVLGSAQDKLFIGPPSRNVDAFLNILLPAAQACSGNIYVALIPHPSEWEEPSDPVQVWRFDHYHWTIVE